MLTHTHADSYANANVRVSMRMLTKWNAAQSREYILAEMIGPENEVSHRWASPAFTRSFI